MDINKKDLHQEVKKVINVNDRNLNDEFKIDT